MKTKQAESIVTGDIVLLGDDPTALTNYGFVVWMHEGIDDITVDYWPQGRKVYHWRDSVRLHDGECAALVHWFTAHL